MQEVYFRLKDKEESWESLARQFSPGDPSANARVGPIEVRQIEPELLEALRAFGVGTVIRPLTIESQVVVAELEVFQASHYNEELKAQILREEFDHWIQEECRTMMNKVNYIP